MDDVHAKIDAAIMELVGDDEEVMPTKWVLVAEYITDSGDTWAVSASSQLSTAWDRIGLLDFALSKEKVAVKG